MPHAGDQQTFLYQVILLQPRPEKADGTGGSHRKIPRNQATCRLIAAILSLAGQLLVCHRIQQITHLNWLQVIKKHSSILFDITVIVYSFWEYLSTVFGHHYERDTIFHQFINFDICFL